MAMPLKPAASAATARSTRASKDSRICGTNKWNSTPANLGGRAFLVLVLGVVGVILGDHGPFPLPFDQRPFVPGFEGVVVVAERVDAVGWCAVGFGPVGTV